MLFRSDGAAEHLPRQHATGVETGAAQRCQPLPGLVAQSPQPFPPAGARDRDDDRPVGMVSGVETTHPDKGTEMFLYELGVVEDSRRRGVATALVNALATLARDRGCYAMWVGVDSDNAAALATYRRSGAHEETTAVVFSWDFA